MLTHKLSRNLYDVNKIEIKYRVILCIKSIHTQKKYECYRMSYGDVI